MKIAFNNRDPVYLQVVRYFKMRMATGELEAGQEVPSRRELASALSINPNTVQKAYKEMEEQGLIRTEGNSPSRITTDLQVLGSIRRELLTEAVQDLVASIGAIQVPVEELVQLVRDAYVAERAKEQEARK